MIGGVTCGMLYLSAHAHVHVTSLVVVAGVVGLFVVLGGLWSIADGDVAGVDALRQEISTLWTDELETEMSHGLGSDDDWYVVGMRDVELYKFYFASQLHGYGTNAITLDAFVIDVDQDLMARHVWQVEFVRHVYRHQILD